MSNTEITINNIVKKVINFSNPEKVILFGSFAWGTPNKDSDVDLMVIQNSNICRFNREVNLRKALFPAGVAVDVISYTPEEIDQRLSLNDFFVKKILTKGKILYAK